MASRRNERALNEINSDQNLTKISSGMKLEEPSIAIPSKSKGTWVPIIPI
ncbi:hypothetical protein CCACVL1_19124 [Corchorus capsularis]|uniref:Uncharacterized protein n=1 Tax=Corchorus capsularis TaxID=210143 RepID=A0A1R3HIF5_COCAP|nr:hypothetical protein CCACVL1_19124 [Corchorus capsularis]